MAESMYSVTLTGRIRAGRDAPAVWARVARLLKLDAQALRERVLERLPVTLKAAGYEDVRRQQEALASSGADVVLLAEDHAPRLWIRLERTTRGPVSMAYARKAMHEGVLPGTTRACRQGDSGWQPLSDLIQQYVPPSVSRSPARPAASGTSSAPAPVSAPVRSGLPGWSLGLVVVVASLALIGALAVLIGVPAYRDHEAHVQIEQGARRADKARAAVAEFTRGHGRMPDDNAEAGLATASSIQGPFVEAVRVDHGRVTVTYGNRATARVRGRHLVFSPVALNGSVTWTCASPDLPRGNLPRSCR